MDQAVPFRRVSISPLELLNRAFSLLGDQYWLFLAIVVIGGLIASAVPFGILAGPMICGMYLCFFHRMRGKVVSFEVLFRGFDFFIESLVVSVLLFVAQIVILVPVIFILLGTVLGVITGGGGAFSVISAVAGAMAYVFVLVLSMILPALFMFAYPLIVDRGLTAIPAMKASLSGAMANLGGIVILWIVYFVIWTLASCACVIPALLFAPIAAGAFALLYQDIFGLAEKPIVPPPAT